MPPRALLRRLAAAVAGALIATLAGAVPAHAATGNDFTVGLAASKGAIAVDLSGAQYAATPDSLRITASRNRCTTASPCWDAPDATLYISTAFNARYTLTGLHANAQYQVQVYADGAGLFTGLATTPIDVNLAPTDPPLAVMTADGLGVTVTAQPETDPEAQDDRTSLADLRYNVYASANGKRLKQVLTKVAGGTTRTISGLPRNTPLTFTETEVNSVGESPETVTPGGVLLTPTAPGAFDGTWQTTAAGAATIAWNTPLPGAGRISTYVVTVASATRTVVTKTVKATVNSVTGLRLGRHGTFTVAVKAVNSYGASTTIGGTLITV